MVNEINFLSGCPPDSCGLRQDEKMRDGTSTCTR
jgi:hypothetical protein